MNAKLLSLCVVSCMFAPMTAQSLDTEVVASGLQRPIAACSPPGDVERIFIAEQTTGRVRIIKNGVLLPTPFLTQTGVNTSGNERGLLGLTFHPNFAQNGYVYLNYTRSGDGATMVVRHTASTTNPDVVQAGTQRTMIGPISQLGLSNHNGGCILFGPDGFLYVGMGDGGGAGDSGCNAQRGSSLLGKMLRLDVDANANGPAVPAAGNPFIGNAAFRDEIWAYGLRNPWRFSFDRETGDMWIGDVGQNALEEIDFQPAASTCGENYGWKIKEGTNCFGTGGCTNPVPCSSPTLVDPVRTLPTSSNCAVVGGYVYRGCAIPQLTGTYFHADHCSSRIYSFEFVNGQVTNLMDRTSSLPGSGSIWSFGEDARGEILICRGSQLLRIVSDGLLVNSDAGAGSVGSNGMTPVYEACGALGPGNTATYLVRNAPANANGAAIFGMQSNPTQLPFAGFGDLVPLPALFAVPLTTDGQGQTSLTVRGGTAIQTLYHQCAFDDAGLGGITLSNAFRTVFNATRPPSISSLSANSASAGQLIGINGSNFQPGATLTVGGVATTPTSVTSTLVQFSMPASLACDSTVVVTNPDGQSASTGFNPTPTISNQFNPQGPRAGGASFIVVGQGFAAGTTATIGGAAATVTSSSNGAVVMLTPPGTPGAQTVVLTTPGGCSVTSTYTYL